MTPSIPRSDKDFQIQDYIPGQPIPSLIRDPRTGKIVVNELKKFVKPFALVTEPALITLAPNAISDPILMPLDGRGHFEIMRSHFQSDRDEGFTVLLFDPGGVQPERPLLMNREIHVATMASGGTPAIASAARVGGSSAPGRPYVWPETYWMNVDEGTKGIVAVFRNLSDEEQNIRFCLHGQRWYHTLAPTKVADRMVEIYRRRFRTMPFFFTTEKFVELDAGGTQNHEIRFGDEAWTEIHKLSAFQTSPEYNVRITEKATDRRLMESAVHSQLVFGDGQFPFLMWEPTLFEPNYKLDFELTDLSDEVNTLWITAACRRIMIDPKEVTLARV